MHSVKIALSTALVAVLATACTSSGGGQTPTSTTTSTTVTTGTRTVTASIGPTAPVDAGPTTSSRVEACPLLPKQEAADRVGMRLERITAQRAGGRVVGCRFYALQGSHLSRTEHLPGPNQPAVEIETTRYASADAAHNAFVLEARKGANPLQEPIDAGNIGVCYQIAFYSPDKGRDWACAYSVGATAVVVRTVVVAPALSVVRVARTVAGRL